MNVIGIETRRAKAGKGVKSVKSAHAQRPLLHCLWLKDAPDGKLRCVWVKDEAEALQGRHAVA